MLEALEALTKREGEDYFVFVARAKAHPLARVVKLADLTDNMNLARLPSPTDKDRERLAKYERAVTLLTSDD